MGSDRWNIHGTGWCWDIIPGLVTEILVVQSCYNAGHEIIINYGMGWCRRIDV